MVHPRRFAPPPPAGDTIALRTTPASGDIVVLRAKLKTLSRLPSKPESYPHFKSTIEGFEVAVFIEPA